MWERAEGDCKFPQQELSNGYNEIEQRKTTDLFKVLDKDCDGNKEQQEMCVWGETGLIVPLSFPFPGPFSC